MKVKRTEAGFFISLLYVTRLFFFLRQYWIRWVRKGSESFLQSVLLSINWEFVRANSEYSSDLQNESLHFASISWRSICPVFWEAPVHSHCAGAWGKVQVSFVAVSVSESWGRICGTWGHWKVQVWTQPIILNHSHFSLAYTSLTGLLSTSSVLIDFGLGTYFTHFGNYFVFCIYFTSQSVFTDSITW